MWEVTEHYRVRLGGNTYIDNGTLVEYKGESLFNLRRHDNGYLGIDFDIYNAEGHKIATVRRNELYLDSKMKDRERFKIDGSANRYTLTDTKNDQVICDIKRREDAQPSELDVAVHLYTKDGFLFDATPEQTNLGGNSIRNSVISNNPVGIGIR